MQHDTSVSATHSWYKQPDKQGRSLQKVPEDVPTVVTQPLPWLLLCTLNRSSSFGSALTHSLQLGFFLCLYRSTQHGTLMNQCVGLCHFQTIEIHVFLLHQVRSEEEGLISTL